jgi:cytochrome c oxidase cbb3-type subunit IV
MFNNILESINGIEIYAITGLAVFLIMFVSVLIWILKVDRTYIEKMEQLPLDKNYNQNFNYKGELNDK